MSNPLLDVHRQLVADLFSFPVVKKYFRLCEDNLTARGGVIPDTKTESNLPVLLVVPVGGPGELNNSSDHSSITLDFRLQIITGDKRFAELYEGLFGLFAALVTIERDRDMPLRQLTWNSSRIVRSIWCGQIDLARFSQVETQEAITGTTSVATISVICDFKQSDLATYAQT